MATSDEILASLQIDLALEHAAIVQYVINGIQLRDVGITDPVRRTAREEMWHFEWLSEAIRDRGGTPSLERDEVFLSTSMATSMVEGVAAEERALAHYATTLEVIGDTDPELTALIERIVADERYHRAKFADLGSQIRSDGEDAYAAHPLTTPEDLAVIGPTIGLEYTGVLQYLLNKYGCGDCDLGEVYFELAIDEMRHLGWAGTYIPGLAEPVPPAVPSDRVRSVHSPSEAHAAAERIEQQASEFYGDKASAAHSEALRSDLERALGQHEYHRFKLERLGGAETA